MGEEENGEALAAEVHAIGISFGNSNSSIAYTTGVSASHPDHEYHQDTTLLKSLSNRRVKLKSLPMRREIAKYLLFSRI